jgi:hypothetical protein
MMSMRTVSIAIAAALGLTGCHHVRPWQRERLASPALQFQMAPAADGQKDSMLEITEGNTFASAGPGGAGAGCGCK